MAMTTSLSTTALCVRSCQEWASCSGQTTRSTAEVLHIDAKHVLSAPSRRGFLVLSFCTAGLCIFTGQRANAEDEGPSKAGDEASPNASVNALLSFFDPNEKTKTGKLLPKSYLKSARKVVKSLRESLKEDSKNEANIRRSADAAKEAIRDYLQNWRGQMSVSSEKSYKALESVFKILGNFYSKQGPRAILTSDVKSQVLENLELAEAAL